MSRPEWFPDWSGETAVIVASGPSAKDAPLDLAKGKARFIAINRSLDLCPWSDVWYGCDFAFWKHVDGGPGFTGLKLTIEHRASKEWPEIKLVECKKADDRIVLDKLNKVGWGGNSGFHALNLAVQFGCSKILMVGVDMSLKYGVHWHGKHPVGMNNPRSGNVERWRRAVDAPAQIIAGLGVKVINCSPVSALRNYQKMTLEEALAA